MRLPGEWRYTRLSYYNYTIAVKILQIYFVDRYLFYISMLTFSISFVYLFIYIYIFICVFIHLFIILFIYLYIYLLFRYINFIFL